MRKTAIRSERKKLQETENKKEIVRAAESLIVRRGFGRLTMDDLSREAQFSKATLYKYFRSKTEVVVAIFVNYFDRIKDRLAGIRRKKVSHSARLKEVIRAVLEMHEESQNISQALLLDEAFMKKAGVILAGSRRPLASSEDRRALKLIHDKIREVNALMTELLADGVKAGEFRATDPVKTVLFLSASMDGFCHRHPWLPVKIDIEESTEFIHHLFLHGLARRGESRKGETR